MPYFHVLIASKDEPDTFRCLSRDLDEAGVKRQFVKPFRRRHSFTLDGHIYRSADIGRVKIRRSTRPAAEELRIMKEESRGGWSA